LSFFPTIYIKVTNSHDINQTGWRIGSSSGCKQGKSCSEWYWWGENEIIFHKYQTCLESVIVMSISERLRIDVIYKLTRSIWLILNWLWWLLPVFHILKFDCILGCNRSKSCNSLINWQGKQEKKNDRKKEKAVEANLGSLICCKLLTKMCMFVTFYFSILALLSRTITFQFSSCKLLSIV